MTRLDYTPFVPRAAAAFHEIVERDGHRLKGYAVRYGERPVDWEEHREGVDMALAALPQANPARSARRTADARAGPAGPEPRTQRACLSAG